MKNKNVNIKQSCHSRMSLSGISRILSRYANKENALCIKNTYVEDPRLQPSGMTSLLTTTRGFTLIELLVVVLIIGILAAVAVPQYRKAVEKSRAAEALIITKAIAQAEQVYRLANGDYSRDITLLDVDIPGTPSTLGQNSMPAVQTNYFICRASSNSTSALWKDALAVCARAYPYVDSAYTLVRTKDGSDYCVYYSDFGEQICKSFGGEKVPEVRTDTYRI